MRRHLLGIAVLAGIAAALGGTVLTCSRKPISVAARDARNAEPASAKQAHSAGMTLEMRGDRYAQIREWDSAFACYRQSLAWAEKSDLADRRYATLKYIAITYDDRAHDERRTKEQALADLDSAATLYTQLLEMVRALDNHEEEALLLYNVGCFYDQSRLDPARAETMYSQSIALSEQIGQKTVWGLATYNRAFVRADQLRLEDARRDFAAVMELGHGRPAKPGSNVAWAGHYVEALDTLINLRNKMPAREWKRILEEHRAEFRDVAREVNRLGVAEPHGFGVGK